MPNETAERPDSSSLLPTIIRLIDSSVKEGGGLDNLITILSLLCLISVFNRQQNSLPASSPASSAKEKESPVGKLIESLMKGGGGGSNPGSGGLGGIGPESLMSLLPLLNNPQLKSKLNPGTISNVLGMLNNLGGSSPEQPNAPKDKKKEDERPEAPKGGTSKTTGDTPPAPQPSPPQTRFSEEDFDQEPEHDDSEARNQGRYLNWKTNF